MGLAPHRQHGHDDEDEEDLEEASPYARYAEDEEALLEQSQRQVLEEKRLKPKRFRG